MRKNILSKRDLGIIERIDSLDKLANDYLLRISDLHMEDFYFMAVVDKSIKLLDSFLFAFEKKNITVLATLTRVQIDCVLRAFASTLVDDSTIFCKQVLFDDVPVRNIVDKNNCKMTDKHLCEELGSLIDLPVYELYQKVCGYVHFSSDSFKAITRAEEDYHISMYISRKNREDEKELFERLSLELASQFLFFGLFLIEDLLGGWLKQIEQESQH